MFQKILAASDLSEVSISALRMAIQLGEEQGAQVVCLYVTEKAPEKGSWSSEFFEDALNDINAAVEQQNEAAFERLRQQIATVCGVQFDALELLIRPGRPAETIVRVAGDVGADLIVVGTHGRRGVLGSVAEAVVRNSQQPVLVLPAKTG